MTTVQPLQILNAVILALLAFTLAVFVLAVLKQRLELYAAVAPLVWLLHGLVFYVAVVARANPGPTMFFTTWSSVLRFQAVFTLLFLAMMGLWRNGHTD